jgi:hypothetical protein
VQCVGGQTVREGQTVGVSVLVPTQTYKRRGAEGFVLFFFSLDDRHDICLCHRRYTRIERTFTTRTTTKPITPATAEERTRTREIYHYLWVVGGFLTRLDPPIHYRCPGFSFLCLTLVTTAGSQPTLLDWKKGSDLLRFLHEQYCLIGVCTRRFDSILDRTSTIPRWLPSVSKRC